MTGRGRLLGTRKGGISLRRREDAQPAASSWGLVQGEPGSQTLPEPLAASECPATLSAGASSQGWQTCGVGDSREEMGGITGLRQALPPIDHEPG